MNKKDKTIVELAGKKSPFQARPMHDLDKAMAEVRELIKKNPKTLEILKH